MNLDIIAQLVQILKDAPEVGAIEVRRGLLGRWSTIRVTKVGHASNAGGGGGGEGGGSTWWWRSRRRPPRHRVRSPCPRRPTSWRSSPPWWGRSIPLPSRVRSPT